jgi:alkaline phosphatase D
VAGAAGSALVAVPGAAFADERRHTAPLPTNPFTVGVASGEPEPDGFVLWTRLALDPLAADGMGGMPDQDYDVEWQIASTDKFAKLAASGTVAASPKWAHSVHVEVDGLKPGHEFFYRFKVGSWLSPIGRTLTAPKAGSMPDKLTMAFVSCQQYEHGWYNAYQHLAEESPDLILHLGDYIYEYGKDVYKAKSGNVRHHPGAECESLAQYRQRHAQYKTDPHLQAAHAAAPWVAVFDDHDVDNNWAGFHYEKPEFLQPFFRQRRAYAFRAYWENMPLRKKQRPQGPDMQLYRRFAWGRLANFHMLDTRQFRDDQGCGDGWKACHEADDPARSITGDDQEKWLIEGFHRSKARWDCIAQQVFFAQRDGDSGPLKVRSTDAWDGYTASRDRITKGFLDGKVRNPVVLSGDVHAHYACELKADYDDPTGQSVGVELVGTSITSEGDGQDSIPEENPFLQINPHIKFYNRQCGYVSTTFTPDQLESHFKVVPKVSQQDQPMWTRRSYTVADGEHVLHQTYSRDVDDRRREKFDQDHPLRNLGPEDLNDMP